MRYERLLSVSNIMTGQGEGGPVTEGTRALRSRRTLETGRGRRTLETDVPMPSVRHTRSLSCTRTHQSLPNTQTPRRGEPSTAGAQPRSRRPAATGVRLWRSTLGLPGRWGCQDAEVTRALGQARGPQSSTLQARAGSRPPGVPPASLRALEGLSRPAPGRKPRPRRPFAAARPSPEADIYGKRAPRAGPGAWGPAPPQPASVSRSLTLLAGGSGRGGSAAARGRLLAPGELGARRRQPAPAPAPRPRPRARRPQSLRPARGRTLAERRRSGPGCASPASTCPTSGASA